MILTSARIRLGGAAAIAGVALIAAGCGSSSSGASSSAGAGSSASAPAATASGSGTVSRAAAQGVSIGTARGSHGIYLTSASGRALYLWVADSGGRSNCSGACAAVWPPLTTKGTPVAAHGVKASELGTITRADGARQVTYHGHPLYYYAADTSAGTTTGQGNDGFGAKWWLVNPSGSAITAGSTGASSAAGSGGSGSPTSSSAGGWG